MLPNRKRTIPLHIPMACFGLNISISELLFIISNIAKFHLTFNIIVLCVSLSNIFTIAMPEISSINGASILINFCSFGFRTIFPSGNKGINLFKKPKQDSHEFIIHSSLNKFFIPKTKSTF